MPDWLISADAVASKIAAYLGAVLGILCTARSYVLDRFRLDLRVVPVITAFKPAIKIQATNVGRVAATVKSLGFSLRGTDKVFWPDPDRELPRENIARLLNPGECVSLYIGPNGFNNPAWGRILRPIAQIADGRIMKGDKVPKQLREDPLAWLEKQTKVG